MAGGRSVILIAWALLGTAAPGSRALAQDAPTSPTHALSDLDDFIDRHGFALLGVIAGGYMLSGSDRDSFAGRQALDAIAATAAVTQALKETTDQPRPGDPDARDGFPSGHTALAFALATAASHDRPRAALPLYALATLVGQSRVSARRHTASQVIASAAIGYGIARLSVTRNGLIGHVFVEPEPAQGLGERATLSDLTWQAPLWRAEW